MVIVCRSDRREAPSLLRDYMRSYACREKTPIPPRLGPASTRSVQVDKKAARAPTGPPRISARETERTAIPDLTNAELVTLRIRVIALENLMISLLATASDTQLRLAREMAGYISPRPGFTQHPLTIHAAAHMVDLVERANHFRDSES